MGADLPMENDFFPFEDSFAKFLNSPLTVSENTLKFSGFPSGTLWATFLCLLDAVAVNDGLAAASRLISNCGQTTD